MKSVTRRVFVAALVAGSCAAGAAWANGDVFFEAEEIPGMTEYVAFGNVKDEDGKYLDNVIVTIDVKEPHLTYDAATNILGRYRTLDIGRAVKDLGFDVDPKLIEVAVFKPGYKMTKRVRISKPSVVKGAVEMNFVMAKVDAVAKK